MVHRAGVGGAAGVPGALGGQCAQEDSPEGLPLGEESMKQPLLSLAELYTIPLSPQYY